MSLRQKCSHCGKIIEFVNDFCVSCWSHRTKGAVLSAEQIARSKERYSVMQEVQRKEAAFENVQRATILPVAILSLWCVWWAGMTLLGFLADVFPWHEVAVSSVCLVGLVVGGFLLGGRKAIPTACAVLIVAGLCGAFQFVVTLVGELSAGGTEIQTILWTGVRLALAVAIVIGAIRVLRTERPVA